MFFISKDFFYHGGTETQRKKNKKFLSLKIPSRFLGKAFNREVIEKLIKYSFLSWFLSPCLRVSVVAFFRSELLHILQIRLVVSSDLFYAVAAEFVK